MFARQEIWSGQLAPGHQEVIGQRCPATTCGGGRSDRLAAPLARADPNAILHRQHEDFPVANFATWAGPTALEDGIDRWLDKRFVDGDLELDLAEQIDTELVSAIGPGLTFLAAKTLAIHDGQTKDLNFGEGFLDRFQLAGLNDRDDEFHEALYEGNLRPERYGTRGVVGSEFGNRTETSRLTLAAAPHVLPFCRICGNLWLWIGRKETELHRMASSDSSQRLGKRPGTCDKEVSVTVCATHPRDEFLAKGTGHLSTAHC